MGLNIIKFEDKTSIKENPVAEANKVTAENINEIKKAINDLIFPIGSIIINASELFDPNSSYGGTWEQFARGKTLIGVDDTDSDFNTSEMTGGEKTHKLTIEELAKHNHRGNPIYYTNSTSHKHSKMSGKLAEAPENGQDGGVFASNDLVGSDKPHNNLPPYITVYFWKRIA